MEKIKIFICCHKPYGGYQDSILTPIHLGRSTSTCTNEMSSMIGDDTGDNISSKNPYYSEATGIYWIWKNVHDVEYVGLCHYRRFFDIELYRFRIEDVLNKADVILPEPAFMPHTVWYDMITYVRVEDMLILKGVLRKLYPEYLPTYNQLLRNYRRHQYNMVICKKSLYDKYAEWLFNILFECEKYIKISEYSNAKRVMGYLAELLTPLYFIHNKIKIKTISVSVSGERLKMPLSFRFLRLILTSLIYPSRKDCPICVNDCFFRGLSNDGIDLDCH